MTYIPFVTTGTYPVRTGNRVMETAGFTEEAVANYQSFLALAPRHLTPAMASVRRRLERLQAAPAPAQ